MLRRDRNSCTLKAKTLTIALALAVLAVSIWPATKLGSEFMPNLNERTLFYMLVSLPGLSITKAAELLQTQDRIIKSRGGAAASMIRSPRPSATRRSSAFPRSRPPPRSRPTFS